MRDDSVSMLHKGIEAAQIFSGTTYIFKVTPTMDAMYRFRNNPKTNCVEEIVTFKRIHLQDASWERFMCEIVREQQEIGFSRRINLGRYHNERFYVIKLINRNNGIKGYKLVPKSIEQVRAEHCLFYKCIKIENRGGNR